MRAELARHPVRRHDLMPFIAKGGYQRP